MERTNGKRFAGYRLIERIGRGGMSTVLRAEDDSREQQVAIKLLSPSISNDPKFKARFTREVRILSDLSHPNIVPIYQYGEEKGFPYIVMPYSRMGTLQDRLEMGPLTPREGARIISDVANALQFAHDHGIVHRDVKPSNILLDEDNNATLSDFGFAHLVDDSLSLTGSVLIGTPAYMSPEQSRGDPVDHRSDQYSLAVILYQISTGSLPYRADTPMGLLVKQIHDPLPRPRAINPNLPDAVEEVLIKALSKDPDKRYPSISTFNDAFQEALMASLDPDTGKVRPEAISNEPITETFVYEGLESELRKRAWYSHRSTQILMALLLLFIPVSTWAVRTVMTAGSSDSEDTRQSASLLETISALSTDNAAGFGEGSDPGLVATALAHTVEAMGLLEQMTPTPTGQELTADDPEGGSATATVTPTPTLTEGGGGLISTATHTHSPNGPGSGTATPVPSPTRTSIYSPTPTPIPSATLEPTATWTPGPTSTPTPPPPTNTPSGSLPTPTPIPPNKCQKREGLPFYCTPTPEGSS